MCVGIDRSATIQRDLFDRVDVTLRMNKRDVLDGSGTRRAVIESIPEAALAEVLNDSTKPISPFGVTGSGVVLQENWIVEEEHGA